MAPPSKSRKGKKAWRKNIDATEVEEFIGEQSYQERRGPAPRDLQDEQLFFMDTSADADGAAAVAAGKRPKRRRDEQRDKPLRSQLILAQAHKAKPVPMPAHTRQPKQQQQQGKEGGAGSSAASKRATGSAKGPAAAGAAFLDLWADEDPLAAVASASGRQQQQQKKGPALLREMGPSAKRLRRSPPPTAVRMRAVEVDLPGCSFNPDREQQQDALALLVAAEMKRELAKELRPVAPPLELMLAPGAAAAPRSELEELQVDADEDEDGDEGQAGLAEEGAGGAPKLRKAQKKSGKDRKRQERRKAADRQLAERAALKAQRRSIDALPAVRREMEEELEGKELRRLRLQSLREDRAQAQPPRLGKQRYEAPSVQVLTSDEITGSLRRLKPCSSLATHRFKALQRRGAIEPRKPQAIKEKRRQVMYEKGARVERQAEATEEVRAMSRANTKARRQLAKGGADADDF